MGVSSYVGFDRFPEQGPHLGRRVEVWFSDGPPRKIGGRCIRDDLDAPHRTIFLLDDGRAVLAGECLYALAPDAPSRSARPAPEHSDRGQRFAGRRRLRGMGEFATEDNDWWQAFLFTDDGQRAAEACRTWEQHPADYEVEVVDRHAAPDGNTSPRSVPAHRVCVDDVFTDLARDAQGGAGKPVAPRS